MAEKSRSSSAFQAARQSAFRSTLDGNGSTLNSIAEPLTCRVLILKYRSGISQADAGIVNARVLRANGPHFSIPASHDTDKIWHHVALFSFSQDRR